MVLPHRARSAPRPCKYQFDFQLEGVRYRPTIDVRPNKTNLRDAARRLKSIRESIERGRRCAFEFGYRDHPEKHNPALGLTCLRMTKKDRPKVDPFTVQEAATVIHGMHQRWHTTRIGPRIVRTARFSSARGPSA